MACLKADIALPSIPSRWITTGPGGFPVQTLPGSPTPAAALTWVNHASSTIWPESLMDHLLDSPLLVFAIAFLAMWLASVTGLRMHSRDANAPRMSNEDFDIVTAATLSLLALIIGFTFSMAASRYDQRKGAEAVEANSIGTEILRTELLPAPDAARARTLLIAYLNQRVLFFEYGDAKHQAVIDHMTDQLSDQMWAAVRTPATAQPTPVAALVVGGMNNVIDARGFTQAAIWNRIPPAAWVLMTAIAILSNALLGYGSRDSRAWRRLSLVLPLSVAISFMLIADIDSAQHGLIRVGHENLNNLAQSLRR
jgi:hypothetical protein